MQAITTNSTFARLGRIFEDSVYKEILFNEFHDVKDASATDQQHSKYTEIIHILIFRRFLGPKVLYKRICPAVTHSQTV